MLLYTLLGLAVVVFVAAQWGWLAGRPPAGLGVTQGRLKPPSLTPNSVSSQSDLYPEHPQRTYSTIEPLPLKNSDGTPALGVLAQVMQTMPGITLVEQRADYLYARSQTPWLKFEDDLEFWVNPDKRAIDVRSASRLGRKDFGVNRRRIEAIRRAYLARP